MQFAQLTNKKLSLLRPNQRLFNYIDDNALINQLLAPFEIGHKVDTREKAWVY